MGAAIPLICMAVPLIIGAIQGAKRNKRMIQNGQLAPAPNHTPKGDEKKKFVKPAWFPKDILPVIGVSGCPGEGKSSFINSLMLMDSDHPDHLKTSGMGECTGVRDWSGPIENYKPKILKMMAEGEHVAWVVDLPGIGGKNFKLNDIKGKTYLQHFGIRYFDVLLIIAAGRVNEATVELAQECDSFAVPKILVRTKIDETIRSFHATDKKEMKELKKAGKDWRKVAIKRAKDAMMKDISGAKQVFAVRCIETEDEDELEQVGKFDFPALMQCIMNTVQNCRAIKGKKRSQGDDGSSSKRRKLN